MSLTLPLFPCRKHLNVLAANKHQNKRNIERAHHNTFHTWFSDHVIAYDLYFPLWARILDHIDKIIFF